MNWNPDWNFTSRHWDSSHPEMKKVPLVGIDLAPAASKAPGTSRYVSEQARVLLSEKVPWKWLPTYDSMENPLFREFGASEAQVLRGRGMAFRATFGLGHFWSRKGCSLGFCTAYFTPLAGPTVVTNFFDSNIYEHFGTWARSGRLANALLIRLLSDIAIYRSQRLFTLSAYCRQYLSRKFPFVSNRLIVTPPGVRGRAENHQALCRPVWLPEHETQLFLYVGTFSENKNQRRLIEAYHLLENVCVNPPALVIAGPYDPKFRSRKLDPSLKTLRFPRKVYLPGRVSESDLNWLYSNALAYFQPSIAEGFGLPVIEAMSQGLPVACSNTTSLPETAGGAALLFDPFDADSIFSAMKSLSEDRALRESLREKGVKRWQEFTWKKNTDLVLGEIDAVLSSLGS